MKHYTRKEIDALDRRFRANLVNCLGGYKPANLIGTVSGAGAANLAIFNSVVHIGANPPLVGFILRPPTADVPRHTYENIKETGVYTINHVHESFVERAHYTSAKFEKGVSEFEKCGLTEEYAQNFAAPFVNESAIKIGLRFVEEIEIKLNNTILVIGEIEHLILPENALLENGNVDLNAVSSVAVAGLDTYHRVEKIAAFPYAKAADLPDFER